MNVLLVTIGSHGDVHPFVGLGIELRRRGYRVSLVTNSHFEGLARSAGLDFVELGTDEEFRELIKNTDLWHTTRGFKAVFGMSAPLIEMSYNLIAERYKPGDDTVVIASSLALGARIAQDKLGVPTATMHLAPAVMRTNYDVPILPGLTMPGWLPHWIKNLLWKFGDRCMVDPVVAPAVNELRAKLGLKPVSAVLRDWWHSPQLILGMWPDWFGAVQPDWPKQMKLVGFPLYDETGIIPIATELDEWLNSGTPPVAFTAGSAMIRNEAFFRASADACAKLNRRGILLTRHADQIPKDLPSGVRHVEYAPFGLLLPRCAALVHHGGIGTTAQALRAGTPQLIMPMAHDQFDNGNRVKRLDAGRTIDRKHYRPSHITPLLAEVLDSPQIAVETAQIARQFASSHALIRACELIERLSPAFPGN